MLKAFLERCRMKKTLERYVSPEIARQIAEGNFDASAPTPAERVVDIVLIALHAPDVTTCSERLSILPQLAAEHGALIHTLLPVAVFSLGSLSTPAPGARLAFVAAVQSRLPGVATVHGSVTAHVGSFGSSEYLEVGLWWPGALDAIRQLAALCPGSVHELTPDDRRFEQSAPSDCPESAASASEQRLDPATGSR